MRRSEAVALALLAGLLLAGCRPAPEAPTPLLPALAAQAAALDRISLAQADGKRMLVRREGRWWIENEQWPVARRWLDPLLVGLLDARCDEPRTARPEHFDRLGLVWPSAPDPLIGAAFARPTGRLGFYFTPTPTYLYIGHPHPRGGSFVRVEGAPSSCLSHADLRLPVALSEWREPQLLDAPWWTPLEVGVAEAGPVRWLRPDEPDHAALWSAAANLRQIELRPARLPLPPAQRRLHLRAADGRLKVVELRGRPELTWARVDAPDPRYAGREFRLPHDVAVALWVPLADAGASP